MAQTGSFIPKQAKPTANRSRSRTVRKVYLFSYISYVVFFGTLLVVAGMFLYEIHLNNNLSSQKALLAIERKSFSQSDIERVRELDQKLIMAEKLFYDHVSADVLLEGFEKTVLENVQFTSFSFLREPDGGYLVTATGVTDDFDSLLFQRQVLKDDDLFSGAEVANISYEPGSDDVSEITAAESQVTFELKKVLSANDISFMKAQASRQANEPFEENIPDVIIFDDALNSGEQNNGDVFFDDVTPVDSEPVEASGDASQVFDQINFETE